MKKSFWHSMLSAFLALKLVVGLSPAPALAAGSAAGDGSPSGNQATAQKPLKLTLQELDGDVTSLRVEQREDATLRYGDTSMGYWESEYNDNDEQVWTFRFDDWSVMEALDVTAVDSYGNEEQLWEGDLDCCLLGDAWTIGANEVEISYGDASTTAEVTVTASTDLYQSRFELYENTASVKQGSAVEIGRHAVYMNGDVLDRSAYEFVFYDDEGEELASAPVVAGTYEVAARAKAGSGYEGETGTQTVILEAAPPWEGGLLAGELAENARVAVTTNKAGLYYSFKPAATGRYVFYSTDSTSDPYGALYSATGERIASDDDGGADLNFWMNCKLSAGQTYYVLACSYGSAASYTLHADKYDAKSLAYVTESRMVRNYAQTGSPIGVRVRLFIQGKEVPASSFNLRYYAYNDDTGELGAELSTAPSEPGRYCVVVTGKNGYTGTWRGTYRIIGPKDLGNASLALGSSSYDYTGSAVSLDLSGVTLLGKNIPTNAYSLVYYKWEDNAEDDGAYVPCAVPSAVGDYYVAAKAKAGSGYTGETGKRLFSIKDAHNLSNASLYLNKDLYVAGSPVEIDVEGVYLSGESAPASVYELVYYRWSDEEDNYVPCDKPSEVGTYYVAAKAKEGSGYTGETDSHVFRIVDAHNLDYADLTLNETAYVAGSPVELDMRGVFFGETAVPKSAYDLVYYRWDSETDENVTCDRPSAAGSYYVAAKAKAGSGYTGETSQRWFELVSSHDFDRVDLQLKKYTYAATGSAIVPEVESVSFAGKAVGAGAYSLVYYSCEEYYDEGDEGWSTRYTELTGAPKQPGVYAVAVRAKAGSGYTGESYKERFTIIDAHQLGNGTLTLAQTWYVTDGSPVQVRVEGLTLAGATLPNAAYELVYSQYNDYGDEEEFLPSAPTEPGLYYVAAKARANSGYTGKTYGRLFHVVGNKSLDDGNLTLSKSVYAATGSPVEPTIESVFLGELDEALVPASAYDVVCYGEDGDYDIVKLASAPSAIGSYYVTAKAKANSGYTGETDLHRFRIVDGFDLNNADLCLAKDAYAATGSPVVLALENVSIAGEALPADAYDLAYYAYEKNSDGYVKLSGAPSEKGEYQVLAKGKGRYKGETSREYFEIVDPNSLKLADFVVKPYKYAFTGSPVALRFSLTMNGKAVPASGYDLVYVNGDEESDWDEGDIDLSTAPTDRGFYGVAAVGKGKYTDSTDYEDFEIVDTESIAGASLELTETSFVYNGEVQKPEVKAVDGKRLAEGWDYTVTYSNESSKEAGSYTVQVTGMGGYTGTSAQATYTIAKADGLAVTVRGYTGVYDGKAHGGSAQASKAQGTKLEYSADGGAWKTAAPTRKAAGTTKVRVRATNPNYATAEASYNVVVKPKSIARAKIVLVKNKVTFNGKVQAPKVKTVGGVALKAGVNYTVKCVKANPKNAGTYKVSVTGKGNYAGTSAVAKYQVVKAKNPLKFAKKITKGFKAKDLAKKAKAFNVKPKGAKGKVTYKASMNAKAKKALAFKNGKLTVKKGAKAGTYKVTIKATAAGNANYKKGSAKTIVTVKVK